jgi:hypothetical protein
MKYFRVTDLTTGKDYLISSTLPNESCTHVAMSAHLDPNHKYKVEEITARAYWGFPECTSSLEDDWDNEDDEECWD